MSLLSGIRQNPPPEQAADRPVLVEDGATTPHQRYVQEIAKRLFRAFYRETAAVLKSWEANEDRTPPYSKDRKKLWAKMAQKLLAAGITNPEGYVHQQFAPGYTRQPSQVVSAKAIEKYEEGMRGAREQQQLAWRSEAGAFHIHAKSLELTATEMTRAQVQRSVLANLGYDFSPLFRYCVAVQNGHTDLATLFHDAALQHLLTDTEGYACNWLGKIPRGLLEEAAGILGTSFVRGN